MRNGFTLAELLIVIAIAALLFLASGLFRPAERLQTLELERATELVHGELIRARDDTRAAVLDNAWGVSFSAQTTTRFAGANFASRDPQYDIMHAVDPPVALTGMTEIVFTRPHGTPNTPGSITITDGAHSRTITINAAGVISLE